MTDPELGFDHPALLYRTRSEYLAGTLTLIEAARAGGRPVLVAVPTDNLRLIRAAIGDPTGITFADMVTAGRNPGRILPMVLLDFAGRHPGQRIAVVGEPVWPGRTELEYPACVLHEALINLAFADRPATILCPYDVGGLDSRAVSDAYRTHPFVLRGSRRSLSPAYTDPTLLAAELNQPLPSPPPTAATMAFADAADLGALRRFTSDRAGDAGLPADRIADLTLMVDELAANTIRHSGGGGRLRVWRDGHRLAAEVEDGGHLVDVLAGRIPPDPAETHGRGLVMVNALADLVRVYTRPGRTVVRVYVRGDSDAPPPADAMRDVFRPAADLR